MFTTLTFAKTAKFLITAFTKFLTVGFVVAVALTKFTFKLLLEIGRIGCSFRIF